MHAGWPSLRFEGRSAGTVSEVQLFADRNGAVKIERNSNQSFKLMSELRKLMYRPGYGTWFSLTMKIDDQGHAETH